MTEIIAVYLWQEGGRMLRSLAFRLAKRLLGLLKDPKELYEAEIFIRELQNAILGDVMMSFSADEVRQALYEQIKEQGGNPDSIRLIMYDGKYRAPKLETWQELTKIDFTKWLSYVKEYFDCDDFAFTFKCHMAEVFLINGVAVASGTTIDIMKKTHGHAWNLLLVNEDGKPVFYTYDPQRGAIVKGVYDVNYLADEYIPNTIIL